MGIVTNGVEVFLLVFVRMTGLFVVAPIFGRRNIPSYLKIGFSLLLALILINTISQPKLDSIDSFIGYAALVVKEFLTGIALGFISYLAFTAIYLAGQLIDMQIGFGMVNVIDPVSNIQVPITSNLYFIVSMLVFLTLNGHHMLIRALCDSYRLIPVGTAVLGDGLLKQVIDAFSNIFVLGLKISAPIIASILVSDVALGLISKTVPQLNVFFLGMPLKILLGLVIMMLTIPLFISIIDLMINNMNSDMYKFMKDMVQGR